MELNKKDLKNILTEQREEYQRYLNSTVKHFESQLKDQREEYQRYLGVVSEGFESQVKLVAESITGVQRQLFDLRDMVAKNTEDIEIMKMDLHIIKNDLKEKADRSELLVLEKRVARLEKAGHNK